MKNSLLADIGRLSHDAPVFSDTDLEDAMMFREHGQDDDMMDGGFPEEEALEAIVASYEQQSQSEQRPPSPTLSDEEYDDVFAELIAQEQPQSQPQSSGERMDMS